jgi:hypothetical protein
MPSPESWNLLAAIMAAPIFWSLFAAILVVLDIWAVTRVIKSASNRESRGLWIVLIVFIPVVGLLAWLLVGPKAKAARSGV